MPENEMASFCEEMKRLWPGARFVELTNAKAINYSIFPEDVRLGDIPLKGRSLRELTLREAEDVIEDHFSVYPGPEFLQAITSDSEMDGEFEKYHESHEVVEKYADAIGLSRVDTGIDGGTFIVSLELEQLVAEYLGRTVERVGLPSAWVRYTPIPNPGHEELLKTFPRASFPEPETPDFERGPYLKGADYGEV